MLLGFLLGRHGMRNGPMPVKARYHTHTCSQHIPFEVHLLIEAKLLHAGHVRLHLRPVRVADRNVDRPHLAELLEDALEDALARFRTVLVLGMARAEPLDWQIAEMDRVRPFARLHLVHVAGIAEKRVPIVPGRELVLRFRCPHLDRLVEPGQSQRAAVEPRQDGFQFALILQLSLEPYETDGALRDLRVVGVEKEEKGGRKSCI